MFLRIDCAERRGGVPNVKFEVPLTLDDASASWSRGPGDRGGVIECMDVSDGDGKGSGIGDRGERGAISPSDVSLRDARGRTLKEKEENTDLKSDSRDGGGG